MPRKSVALPPPPAPVLEWDRSNMDSWHSDFEKEPVNDEKWTCIVTAAIQSETEDEECVNTYIHCVNKGLRRNVKVISMADVVTLLKEHIGIKSKKEDSSKSSKTEKIKTSDSSLVSSSPQIVELAAKYATITDLECKLPPDLMAAVVKYLILKLKHENCLEKRIETVRARKIKERTITARFIRSLKPFERSQNFESDSETLNTQIMDEAIQDHPLAGPDLYIMLVHFYDAFYFPEMLKLHIPFVAILKIVKAENEMETYDRVPLSSAVDQEEYSRRALQIGTFWKNLAEECLKLEKTSAFKDIAMMQYVAPLGHVDSNQYLRKIFDELTWMQYSAYSIYRQHQKYLLEMYVQRVFLSLEPLDLSRCNVYNKLCDALITGEPLTPLLVLYALVEQVVAGVPETKSTALEYQPKPRHFFSRHKRSTIKKKMLQKTMSHNSWLRERPESFRRPKEIMSREGIGSFVDVSELRTTGFQQKISTHSIEKVTNLVTHPTDTHIHEALIDQVLSERKLENEKNDKIWKTPVLCFHGDFAFRQSFYCDPRLFDAEKVIRRFLENPDFFPFWNHFPEMPPEEKAYFNYHFYTLWKISQQRQDLLKIKIFFTLSARLIRSTKSKLYLNDYKMSDTNEEEGRLRKPSRAKFCKIPPHLRQGVYDFSNFFFKTFIEETCFRIPRKTVISFEDKERLFSLSVRTGSQLLMKTVDHLHVNPYQPSNFERGINYIAEGVNIRSLSAGLQTEKDVILSFLLECPEFSSLVDQSFLSDNEICINLIKSLKFYEKLDSNLMVQRLLEAGECFNTIQCLHFLPTDTLVITMYNAFDERGVFSSSSYGALPTPVALRDFYSYVYPEITEWLIKEQAEDLNFLAEVAEKAKAHEDREDEEYMIQLQLLYCKMSLEEQNEFIETVIDFKSEPEVLEEELPNLPIKPRPVRPKKVSFVTTNFTNLRVENNSEIREFHSRDGTNIRITIDKWLYKNSDLLKLEIKRSDFLLYYYKRLDQESNTSFTFKTVSDIIFSFYLETEDDFKYTVSVSWPTGLLIRPIWTDSTLYLKQGYLKSCRNRWRPEEEDSRCFLKNGHIVVFKSNGDYEVLCSGGTKYCFYDSLTTPRYEIISTTGEVWEIRNKGPCKGRRKLIMRNKIFIGFDPKTQESYYKRDDGMHCMLWQSGKLVTSYPDGTKITSIPHFDEEEINLEWSEEEKHLIEELIQKFKSEHSVQEPRSRTILRNSSVSKGTVTKSLEFEGFVSVSCAYLMEHPKYSTVYYDPCNTFLKVTLPERLTLLIYPEGTYEVQQDNHFLKVLKSEVEFQTVCNACDDTSTVKINLNPGEILCSLVDMFQKKFFVLSNGEISFQELSGEDRKNTNESEKTNNESVCCPGHSKTPADTHVCFALERDLSGVEFLHEDWVALHPSKMPGDTYHEQNENKDADINHTFSSYCYKAGYESWVMNYEDQFDSLPVHIKKKDLKELGAKQVTKKLFQYPFPKHSQGSQMPTEKVKNKKQSPKLIVTRTFLSLSDHPQRLIKDVQKYVAAYQNRAQEIYKAYLNRKSEVASSQDSQEVEMRLRKIAQTLNKSSHMYPHLCTQLPSTEVDIHYFAHVINFAEDLKYRIPDYLTDLPKCKQIPVPLPRSSKLPPIEEEKDHLQLRIYKT